MNTAEAYEEQELLKAELAENDCIQSICRESFFEFVKEFWEIIIQEDPIWNWHIEYLCGVAQEMAERIFKRLPKLHDLVVNIPPGTTKSTIFSIMFPVWLWTRQPEIRIISASYEEQLALKFAVKSRDIIISEKFQRVFRFKKNDVGRWRPSVARDAEPILLKQDQNAKSLFANTMGGERMSVGAGGHITGSHGHVIIVDDPINPKEAVSEAGLLTINRWMRETLPTRKVDKKVAPTMLIMQRLHQNDPTANMLEKKKEVFHVCLPGEDSKLVRPLRLRLKYQEQDGLLDPNRLDRKILGELKEDLLEYGYSGQIEQNPVPEGGGLFKMSKISFVRAPRISEQNYEMIVRYWDKAGTKDGGKRTAGGKVGKTADGRIIILHMVKGQWAAGEREQIILETAQMDTPLVVVGTEQEPGSGGLQSAEDTVKNLMGFDCRVDKVTGDKATRAEPLARQVQIGNVFVALDEDGNEPKWWADLRTEMAFFPFSKFKDQVDSLSGAFGILNVARVKRGAYGR